MGTTQRTAKKVKTNQFQYRNLENLSAKKILYASNIKKISIIE